MLPPSTGREIPVKNDDCSLSAKNAIAALVSETFQLTKKKNYNQLRCDDFSSKF